MTREDLNRAATLAPQFRRAGRRAEQIGLAGVGVCALVWVLVLFLDKRWPEGAGAFYRAWLTAWLLCLGISLGAMAAVMVHHLTGGDWGFFVRRFGEAAANVLPLLFLLFVPVLVGLHRIYPWADPENHSALIIHKRAYLNPGFFIGRYIAYFIIWMAMARLLRSLSLRYDRDPSPRTAHALRTVSAVGLVLYVVTMSLGAIDWIMSMDPAWYSTVFGFIVCMGQTVAGTSLLIIVLQLMSGVPPFAGRLRANHFNDLATLLVTTLILWAYNSFAQLLIIWIANVQHEVNWYVQRNSGPWRVISMFLCFLGFLAPFVLLLQRSVKKRGAAMLWVCVGLLGMRLLDVYWMVAPGGVEPYPRLYWFNAVMSIIALIGIGGLWVAAFFWLLDGPPLMPQDDAAPAPVGPSGPNRHETTDRSHGTQPATQPGLA